MMVLLLRSLVFMSLFFSWAQASLNREALLEDAIREGGAPTVAALLGGANLEDNADHRALAREALIMVYLDEDHDPELSDFDYLFAMADVANTDDNLELVASLIALMPEEGSWESHSSASEGDGEGFSGWSSAAGAA